MVNKIVFHANTFPGKSFLENLINVIVNKCQIPKKEIKIIDFGLDVVKLLINHGYEDIEIDEMEKINEILEVELYKQLEIIEPKIIIFDQVNDIAFQRLVNIDFPTNTSKYVIWILSSNIYNGITREKFYENGFIIEEYNSDNLKIFEKIGEILL